MMGEAAIVLLIVVGIPVVSVTVIVLEAMKRKDRKRQSKMEGEQRQDREAEIIEEIYRDMKSLRSRIENLETIYKETRNKE
jgi:uncharacterized membrane protein